MSRSLVRFALVLGLLMGALTWAAIPAQAATVSGCYSDQAQLQSAIASAGAGGIVQFSCDATIHLTSTIALANVSIDGNGHDVTISGNNSVRVFSVSPPGNVVLKGLNLIDGNAGTGHGGAVFASNYSTVSVIDSTLSGNTGNAGGAIYRGWDSTLNVSGSTLSGNTGYVAGAIYASFGTTTISNSQLIDNTGTSQAGAVQADQGSLTISGSTVSGNTSPLGGAVLAVGVSVAITDSTVSGNSGGNGGGVVDVRNGTATMTNTTVSGNTGRPVLVVGGSLQATNITVVGNAVYAGTSLSVDGAGSVTLTNSILAGDGPGGNCQLYNVASFVNGGGNLATDASCTGIPQVSTAALNLGPLADNGGPTKTHALLDDSAAIGAGVSSVCNAAPVNGLDQRGYPRNAVICDSGAYDTGGVPADTTPPTVTITGIADGALYTLGDVIPTAGCDTTDDESGVAIAATLDSSGGPLGPITLTCDGAVDNAGNAADPVSVTYTVVYAWSGFLSPVDNLPAINAVKAGAGVPVKFSLGGDQGLGAVTAITSVGIGCDSSAVISDVETTVAAGSSSLQYDPTTGEYTYVWKTAKSWSGTCRQLTLTLADGTSHTASFLFR